MHHFIVFLTATPAPSPSLRPGVSPEDITPGTLGFVMTALFVLATTLLLVDMSRRVRRVRYRGQVEEERLAEAAAADAAAEEQAAASEEPTEGIPTTEAGTGDEGTGGTRPEEPGPR